MSNEIKMNKTTAYLLVGLLLAIVLGGYLVSGADSNQPSNFRGEPSVQPRAPEPSETTRPSAPRNGVQEVYLKATGYGYDKDEIIVKKGIPVRLHFSAENAGCGSQLVIYGLNVRALSRGEETVVDFTPTQEGTYQYSCGMRMFPPGKFIVTA